LTREELERAYARFLQIADRKEENLRFRTDFIHEARIAWLPGDGIGPEVLRRARRVLEIIAGEHNHEFDSSRPISAGFAIERHGEPLPKATQDICLKSTGSFSRLGGLIRNTITCRREEVRKRPARPAEAARQLLQLRP